MQRRPQLAQLYGVKLGASLVRRYEYRIGGRQFPLADLQAGFTDTVEGFIGHVSNVVLVPSLGVSLAFLA